MRTVDYQDAPETCSILEACKRLGLSRTSVKKLIDRGDLRTIRFPGLKPRVSVVSIARVIEETKNDNS